MGKKVNPQQQLYFWILFNNSFALRIILSKIILESDKTKIISLISNKKTGKLKNYKFSIKGLNMVARKQEKKK